MLYRTAARRFFFLHLLYNALVLKVLKRHQLAKPEKRTYFSATFHICLQYRKAFSVYPNDEPKESAPVESRYSFIRTKKLL